MFDQKLYESFMRQCLELERSIQESPESKIAREIKSQIIRIKARLGSMVEKSYLNATDEIFSLRAILREFIESYDATK